MSKITRLFLTKDLLRIVTYAKAEDGSWMHHEPVYFVELSEGPRVIGQKALEAFDHFGYGLKRPVTQEEWKESHQNFLKKLKLKSWKPFVKISKSVSLGKEEKNEIRLVPKKNLIAAGIQKEGDFKSLEEKTRYCDASDPQALGEAILAAFEDCE